MINQQSCIDKSNDLKFVILKQVVIAFTLFSSVNIMTHSRKCPSSKCPFSNYFCKTLFEVQKTIFEITLLKNSVTCYTLTILKNLSSPIIHFI